MQEYQVKAVIQVSVNNTLEKDKISACLADVIKEVERGKKITELREKLEATKE